jgi:2-polyprenyl-3-methyl-5-hydroxy-6-metoxy-1,4-benzoquinol methylase
VPFWRHRTVRRSSERAELERRIRELQPWYQNIEVAPGVFTKQLGDEAEIFPEADIPAPLWRRIEPDLGDIAGQRVLDIGCNAGYMSFECKKRGAGHVLGIDNDLGATASFIEQARFCRDALQLDVEFEEGTFLDLDPDQTFDLVLFCGVLYHLENWADGLDKLKELVTSPSGRIVLETAIEPVTQTYYEGKAFLGDTATFFVPSVRVLLALLDERGLRPQVVRDLGTRAIVWLTRG